MREVSIHVAGIPWTVRYTAKRPRHNGEECDGTMSPREEVIRVWRGGTDDKRLRTVLHEWFHVRFPDFDEDAILGLEADMFEAIQAFHTLEGE